MTSRWDEVVHRIGSLGHKMLWGIRVVGVLSTIRGIVRFLELKIKRPSTAVVNMPSGMSLRFDYPSQMVPALVVFGDLIDPEFPLIDRLMKPGWTTLDVGAAIGQFTVFSARLPSSKVHAFEPSRANIKSLTTNVALNGSAPRVTVHQMALSDSEGEAVFTTAENAYLSRLDRPELGSVGEKVQVKTLSNVLDELHISHVNVLKINVSGFEPEVIKGAFDFLDGAGADILVLLIGDRSYSIYLELVDLGYEFYFYHPIGNYLYALGTPSDKNLATPPWPARHVLAIHRSAIASGMFDEVGFRSL